MNRNDNRETAKRIEYAEWTKQTGRTACAIPRRDGKPRRFPFLRRGILALCAALAIGMAGEAASESPSSGMAGDEIRWTLDDTGVLTIRGQGAMDDYVSAGRAPWQPRRMQIFRVRVGDSVTKVGNYAFTDLPYLESVEIGDDVETVGNYAFYNCVNLERITLGTSVRELGTGAFSHCGFLRDPVLPDSLETVGQSAFSYCDSLEAPDLPDGVKEVKAYAFSNCPRLWHMGLPYTLRAIGARAFEDCPLLWDITLPGRVTTLGPGAFSRCAALREVVLPITLDEIASRAFAGSGLEAVTIPGGVTEIGAEAFDGCSALQYAVIGRGVTEIGDRAFRNCPFLRDVYYPETENRWNTVSMDEFRRQIRSQGITVHLNASGPEDNSDSPDGGNGTDNDIDGNGNGNGMDDGSGGTNDGDGAYITSVVLDEYGAAQVDIFGDPGENSVLVAAAYAADGRLLDAAVGQAAGGGRVELLLSTEDVKIVSAFLLDGRGRPMAGQVRYRVP